MDEKVNSDADAKVADALATLKQVQALLGKTPTRDMPFCTTVSHVREYQNDDDRLRQYGSQVIGNRSMEFALLASIKAYWNIQTYLDGVSTGNAMALPAAARSQIEIFALTWHVWEIVLQNGGFSKPDLAQRMLVVDEALIMAIHGSRDKSIAEFYGKLEVSKLRPVNKHDLEVFKAKNILTRIQKADSGSQYKTVVQDYDRLSDMLHPNGGQNMIFRVFSPKGEGWYQLGLRNSQHVRRVQYQSAHAMQNASAEILRLITETPDPFNEFSN